MTDELTRATEALREISGDDPERAAATRRRLRESLEERPRGHRWSSILAALGIGLGATTAFAFATGQAQRVWSALVDDPAPATAPDTSAAPARTRVAVSEPAPATATATDTEPEATTEATAEDDTAPRTTATIETPPERSPEAGPEPAPAPAMSPHPTSPRPTSPRPRDSTVRSTETATSTDVATLAETPAATPAEIEALYRRAHELHFRGNDLEAALRAWDDYLAVEPSGRFAVEARYNRAILLVRLRRVREAREALAPFARGEVAGGYRREDAQQLLDRLARWKND